MKGKADPISITDLTLNATAAASNARVIAADGSVSSLGADPSAPPLQQHVGREAELKVMAELAEDYLVGEREAVTVVVEARQGMGKVCSPF